MSGLYVAGGLALLVLIALVLSCLSDKERHDKDDD